MDIISAKDREILRARASLQAEYANCEKNDRILKQWDSLSKGKKENPTVRLLFSNFPHEVITPRLKCEGDLARQIESSLLNTLVGRELFDDDTPISQDFKIFWQSGCRPFGAKPHLTYASQGNGFHIDPVIEDLKKDFDLLKGGSFFADRESTLSYREQVEDVIGDILPTKMAMGSLCGMMTNPLVNLMGMENYYMSMYDCPEKVHEAMDMAAGVYESYYDFLEKEKLLLPTCGNSPINQESFAYNEILPKDHADKTTDCWGFLESQETTAVSPETFGEFVFPYQDRLVRRFGLLSYGCCERVDAIWPDYLSKWKNLRKLSVSPFNNEMQVGEYLRGSSVIYYSKPRAEYVTNPGPLDVPALKKYFKGVCTAASGCLFEMAQREVGTIFGDFNRGKEYVQIARESIAEYWKP